MTAEEERASGFGARHDNRLHHIQTRARRTMRNGSYFEKAGVKVVDLFACELWKKYILVWPC
jgi:hypothetical protein